MKTFKQFCTEAPILKKPIGKSGTRSGLMGMSSSLSTSGTPSGQKFLPGQGDSYGISGIKLAT